MGITIKDIAEKGKVSIATVSRVLNNKPDVSNETKEKIIKLIDKMGYNPNNMARSLVLKKTYTIGLVIPDICNPFFPDIARAVEDTARGLGYSIIFYNTDNHVEEEKKAVEILMSRQVDGLIVSLSMNEENKQLLGKLRKENYPIVQIDRKIFDTNYTSIAIDNILSAYKATSYLIDLGHTRIVHITGDMNTQTGQERLEGYKKALRDSDIEVRDDYIFQGDYNLRYSQGDLKKLFKSDIRPTAIFTAYDLMAVGTYKLIRDCGLTIPEDVSIVGHDNIDLSSLVKPSLTTVSQPKYRMGQLATSFLVKDIEGEKYQERDIVLDTKLIKRSSTRNLRGQF